MAAFGWGALLALLALVILSTVTEPANHLEAA